MNFYCTPTSKRCVALLLVTMVCLCLGVEDFLAPDMCGEDQSSPLSKPRATALLAAQGMQHTPVKDHGDDEHDCLCCCHHLLTPPSVQSAHALKSSILTVIPGELVSSLNPRPPCHPPRSLCELHPLSELPERIVTQATSPPLSSAEPSLR